MKPAPAQDWMEQRLLAPGPKRILAIDGRGASPVVAAGLLIEVEARLRALSHRSDFRLCDYFDLIGGASTGAIAAAGFAMGGAAAEVADFCAKFVSQTSGPRGRTDPRAADAFLTRTLGDTQLGGDALRTGLAIFAKSAETGAVWAITNNPRSRYWDGSTGAPANRTMLLRRALQASLGAPAPGEEIALTMSEGTPPRRFFDPTAFGLSNPALHLLLLGTLSGYGLEWATGPDRILMLSAGAGAWPGASLGRGAEADRAGQALAGAAQDASQLAITILQGMGATARPWRINSALGDMRGTTLSPVPGLHFQRLEALLSSEMLAAAGVTMSDQELGAIRAGSADPMAQEKLLTIARAVGALYFSPTSDNPKRRWERAIFPRKFDPSHFRGPPPGPPRFKLQALGRAWEETS